jgi:hypothetical protein
MQRGARDEEALLPGWHGQEGGQPDTSRCVLKFLPKRGAVEEVLALVKERKLEQLREELGVLK